MSKRHRETTVIGDVKVLRVPGPSEPGFRPLTDASIALALASYRPPADPAPDPTEEPIDAAPPVSETADRGDTERTHPNPSRQRTRPRPAG